MMRFPSLRCLTSSSQKQLENARTFLLIVHYALPWVCPHGRVLKGPAMSLACGPADALEARGRKVMLKTDLTSGRAHQTGSLIQEPQNQHSYSLSWMSRQLIEANQILSQWTWPQNEACWETVQDNSWKRSRQAPAGRNVMLNVLHMRKTMGA